MIRNFHYSGSCSRSRRIILGQSIRIMFIIHIFYPIFKTIVIACHYGPVIPFGYFQIFTKIILVRLQNSQILNIVFVFHAHNILIIIQQVYNMQSEYHVGITLPISIIKSICQRESSFLGCKIHHLFCLFQSLILFLSIQVHTSQQSGSRPIIQMKTPTY